MMKAEITYRTTVRDSDRGDVRQIVESTGFFSEAEIDIAVELVEEHLSKGLQSGYDFLFAERSGKVVGYTCFGPVPAATGSFDIYWVAVHPDCHRLGIGKSLITHTETLIEKQRGQRIYIETSSRDQYRKTRMFYGACGYRQEAILENYYGPGDGKVIYCRIIPS
jgi:ribosomal protein S18 acetylase RimI-like enzyme